MTKKRRVVFAVMAALLALLMIVPTLILIVESVTAGAISQAEIDALEGQKKGIAEERAVIQSQIDVLESEQATVLEQKAALDRQNELARQEIEIISEEIDLYTKLVEVKGFELEEAIEVQEEQSLKYRTRIRIMEESGSLSYFNILFGAKSFSDFLSRIDFVNEIMQYDSQLESDYIKTREHVEEVKAEFEQTKIDSEEKKGELLNKKTQLEKEIEVAYAMILEIESNIEAHIAEIDANTAAEAALQAEINEMVAELARREEAAKKAAEQAGQSWNASTAVGSSGSFVWPVPTNNYVGSGFGMRKHPIFGDYRMHWGVDIGGNSGETIVAADGGVIVTAMLNSSYGNYVLIDHGNGTMSLYAHMTNYIVSVGQRVNQGETIGYIGSTGWSTGPHLHYEIRVNGSCVDPMSYYSR